MKTRIDSRIVCSNRICSIATLSYFFLWSVTVSLFHPGAFGSTTDDVRPTAAAATTTTYEQPRTRPALLINWRSSDRATAKTKDVSEVDRESATFARALTDDTASREPDNSTRDTEHAGSTVELSVEAQGTTRLSRDSHVTSDSVVYQGNVVDSETTGLTIETTVSHQNGLTGATKTTDATADVAKETTRIDDDDGEATHSTTTASDYAIANSSSVRPMMSAYRRETVTIAITTLTDFISTLTPTSSINAPSTTVGVPAEPAATTATKTATVAATTRPTTVLSEVGLTEGDSVTTETTAVENQLLTETEEQNRTTAVATAVLPRDNEIFSSIPRSRKTTAFVSRATETTPSLLRGCTNSTDNDRATVPDSGSNRTGKTTTTQLRVTTKSNDTANAFYSSSQSPQAGTVASTEASTVASTEASTAAVLSPVLTSSFSCLVFVLLFMRTMA